MLLLLVSIVHITQASKSSANTRNLFIGFRSHRTYQNISWNDIQHYYQSLELKYFKRLLYISILFALIDIITLLKYHTAWLILAELCIYFITLILLSKKVEHYIAQKGK
ncbi:hypothetical protein AMC75_10585 [Staphylococcus carnosus]|uniref:hypothetical protein n=1 Tax=Staphylococcus carnosus TaxID=1281 RepID=UPI0006ABBB33|nr:hypothetical protein [Staphylococcus carnosus]ANZ34290.1 hypothetical protein BEK99_11195 [Staphylococcus carnosus]KOR12169.1 hypothetical protein AMC75_10585 [Staphylococcus carnosus]UTB81662.1 hypothetical protein A2I65_12575 [Staphylococcus carnosus]UTB86480.1 hypothetical protein A2I66_12790 [Staphylococcus carnosus]